MPGFVDVSNMTSEEVRRMGHADDYDEETNRQSYRNPYAYRKPTPKKPSFSFDSEKVWGAAVFAFRTNGSYVKAIAPGLTAHKTNREIVDDVLANVTPISDSDISEGREIRDYFKGLTFNVIKGHTLSPFLRGAMEVAGKDVITDNLGVGIIASLPATYSKMTERDSVDRKIKWAQGGFVGQVGDNVTETIEVIKQLWSNNYNTYYFTGINDKDQVLFFAYRNNIEIGSCVTITGKVKSHRDNSTQLSHVKVI